MIEKVSQSYSEYLKLLVWCCWVNENDGYFIKGGGVISNPLLWLGRGYFLRQKKKYNSR